jgi:octaprenyl-diphosphate synthase
MRVHDDQDAERAFVLEGVPLIFETIERELLQVRSFMAQEAGTSIESVNALVEHVLSRSGKMLRSGLLLLSSRTCGEINEEHIQTGAIVELIHTATLLHDDVLDGARSRRGIDTVNSLWGNESAVLLGDLLLSRAFVIGSRFENPKIGRVLSDTAVKICRGELRQNLEVGNWGLSRENYYEIIQDKTAALFGSCCCLGALIAGGNEDQSKALEQFGLNVGMAFQLADDMLDIVSEEEDAGKTLGIDILQGKVTLPVIYYLDNCRGSDREAFIEKISGGIERKDLIEILDRSGSLDYTRAQAEHFVNEAISCLESVGDDEGNELLAEAARFVVSRCS